ncbi:MAG: SAM-dependent methyltransferase [Pseudomonadota bacterium]
MGQIILEPVGRVHSDRTSPDDDNWDGVRAVIELDPSFDLDALTGLGAFSHVEIVFVFHRVDPSAIERSARHPRGRTDWPKVGIFAQRGKNRPNRLGVTCCQLVGIDDRRLEVRGLDAIDGTPVMDIKPLMRGFLPRGDILEPDWARAIMSEYW